MVESDWTNPTPQSRYDLVVVGGGMGAAAAAIEAAALGGRVALMTGQPPDGECVNDDGLPGKALLLAAHAGYELASADRFGFQPAQGGCVDFSAMFERIHRVQDRIRRRDSPPRLAAHGIDVYLGQAAFTGPGGLEVDGRAVRFRRAVIATGSRPAVPHIEGLNDTDYLTDATILSLAALPRRLIVIGGGATGCELAQAFRRFGSDVHLIEQSAALLPSEEPEASRIVESRLEREGVRLHLGWSPESSQPLGPAKGVVVARHGERKKLIADCILTAIGRQPNLEGLRLEAAGIDYSDEGIEVNDRLQTTNRRVFAVVDRRSRDWSAQAAAAMARLCVRNALSFKRRKLGSLVIPRCTLTDPEVACVGLTEIEAEELGVLIDTYRVPLSEVDRAVMDGDEEGYAMAHARRGTGRVVGATIVARHAGEMIAPITLLMTHKLYLGELARTVHCHPTQVEALKQIADAYNRSRPTPVAAAMDRWLSRWRSRP